jgi:DNA-damage-inducible protein J
MAELRIAIDDNIKEKADNLFKEMGMSTNDAVKIFISQAINSNSLPFRPQLSNNNKDYLIKEQ